MVCPRYTLLRVSLQWHESLVGKHVQSIRHWSICRLHCLCKLPKCTCWTQWYMGWENFLRFKGPDGKPFVQPGSQEGWYIFSLCMDGFNPSSWKEGRWSASVQSTWSFWIFQWTSTIELKTTCILSELYQALKSLHWSRSRSTIFAWLALTHHSHRPLLPTALHFPSHCVSCIDQFAYTKHCQGPRAYSYVKTHSRTHISYVDWPPITSSFLNFIDRTNKNYACLCIKAHKSTVQIKNHTQNVQNQLKISKY